MNQIESTYLLIILHVSYNESWTETKIRDIRLSSKIIHYTTELKVLAIALDHGALWNMCKWTIDRLV